MQPDAFKPQGRELKVVDANGAARLAMARRMVPMPGGPAAPAMAPFPMDPQSRGAAISSKHEVPRGAREVSLVSMGSPLFQQQPLLPPIQQAPAVIPVAPAQVGQQQQQQQQPTMAQAQQRPFLQRQAPRSSEVYRFSIMGVLPDGTTWEAPYDAEFPSGIQLSAPTVTRIA